MKILFSIFPIAFMLITMPSSAKAQSGITESTIVTKMSTADYLQDGSEHRVQIWTQLPNSSTNNPGACDSNLVYVISAATEETVDRMTSFLVAALLSGKQVSFFVSGCVAKGESTHPHVRAVYLEQ